MAGNMTKVEPLDWLVKYGTVMRGWRSSLPLPNLGLGVKRFCEEVAAGLEGAKL